MGVKITTWQENLGKVLHHGSKSIRWELRRYSEAKADAFPNGEPIGDAGSTLDRAMRRALNKARGADAVILLHASYVWHGDEVPSQFHCAPIGIVFEFVRHTDGRA